MTNKTTARALSIPEAINALDQALLDASTNTCDLIDVRNMLLRLKTQASRCIIASMKETKKAIAKAKGEA